MVGSPHPHLLVRRYLKCYCLQSVVINVRETCPERAQILSVHLSSDNDPRRKHCDVMQSIWIPHLRSRQGMNSFFGTFLVIIVLHSYVKKVLVPIIKIEKAPKSVRVARAGLDHLGLNGRLVQLCCQCGAAVLVRADLARLSRCMAGGCRRD